MCEIKWLFFFHDWKCRKPVSSPSFLMLEVSSVSANPVQGCFLPVTCGRLGHAACLSAITSLIAQLSRLLAVEHEFDTQGSSRLPHFCPSFLCVLAGLRVCQPCLPTHTPLHYCLHPINNRVSGNLFSFSVDTLEMPWMKPCKKNIHLKRFRI